MTSQTRERMKPDDFATDQLVRWCPGCGDFAILNQMRKVLAELDAAREKTVFISGIGCAGRFPYYMETYGMHGIHGRAPAIATGLKQARPDLDVWIVSGDGDALSIGIGHLLHAMRRNVDIKVLLFNNRVYGLTKGQFSPTSLLGQVTPSSPYGSELEPMNALSLAVAANCSFIARAVDTSAQDLGDVLRRAATHKGTALVEIYQNCHIFNDGTFDYAKDRKSRAEHVIELEHGRPMVFGTNLDKGLRLNGSRGEVVTLGRGISETELLHHDERSATTDLAHMLAGLQHPEMPEVLGVLRDVTRTIKRPAHSSQDGNPNWEELLQGDNSWVVE